MTKVYRYPRINRTKRALVGAAIGVAVGALLTNKVGDRFRNEGKNPREASGLEAPPGLELESMLSPAAVIRPCIKAQGDRDGLLVGIERQGLTQRDLVPDSDLRAQYRFSSLESATSLWNRYVS